MSILDNIQQIGNNDTGQIGFDLKEHGQSVQLYDLNPTGNVVIQYNKGGNPQTVTLNLDTLDGTLDASLDRDVYPQGCCIPCYLN